MTRFEKAVLLALETMLDTSPSIKERKERRAAALKAINDALESGGVRYPDNTNNW